MVVAFKHMLHDNDLIDTFISLWTGTKFIHAQVIFSDRMAGSSWIDTGVTFKTEEETVIYPFLFTFVEIPTKKANEQMAREFIESQLNKPFDMHGAVLSTAFPHHIPGRRQWHCAEISFGALRAGGLLEEYKDVPPSSVTPGKLYDMVTNI